MLNRWKHLNPVIATEAGFLAVIAVLFFFNAMYYWSQAIDDAYITFRFAENLAGGQGLRFNPGDLLVEGFTSPAWVLLSTAAIWLGLDPMVVAKLAGLASGFALIGLSWRFTKSMRARTDGWNLLPPVLIATNAHVAFWAMQGMETLLQAAAVLAAYHWTWRWLHEGKRAALAAVLIVFAVFVRIDSVVLLGPLGMMVLGVVGWRWWRNQSSAESGESPSPANPIRRYFGVRWMAVVAGALIVMQGMRILIFGEWLPNTYYAKVAFAPWNGERAWAYLFEFYFNQGGWSDGHDVGSFAWWLSGGPVNSLAWMNLWLAALMLLIAGSVRILSAREARACMLVLAAIAVTTWYAWHVGGDWMPGFRFLIPVVVFLSCGLVLCLDVWQRLTQHMPRTRVVGIALLMLMCAGTISEQSRTETVYVFGRDPIWIERTERWLSAAMIGERFQRGFEPALLETTTVLALETQAGARILMSDIGLPMWSSPHLHVIDADGLVDKHLADAPSVRGEEFDGRTAPTRREITEMVRAKVDDVPMTGEFRRWISHETERLYREAVMEHNVLRIMEEVRPEYILVFEVHPGEDTSQAGKRYPEVIERATQHPEFSRYILRQSWRKADGNVWNHLYRRADVPLELSQRQRQERLEQLVARNPRVRIFKLMDLAGRIVNVGE